MSLHRAIILTTDKKTLGWKSLSSKMLAFTGVLNSMKNADFTLEIEYFDFTPEVVVINGRITRESFDSLSLPLLKQGYDFVLLHMSKAQWVKWGIQPSLRGTAQNDTDEVAEGYFWADENTKRNGYNQFIEVGLHETSHLFCYGAKRLDETHAYHDANGTIVGLFLKYDMENYQRERFLLKKRVSFLQGVLAKLKATVKPQPGLLPAVAAAADRVMADMDMLGHPIRITEGYRSLERQAELYAQGRTTKGTVVTNAKPGESWHNYQVAFDVVFRKQGYNASDALWETLGTVGEKHGLDWGGRWREFVDKPHFQMTQGYTLADFQNNKVDYSKFS
jgi:hypothetical protein